MRIETLNGMANVNGLSRVNPVNGLSRVNLNGLSRVNLNATYTLNNGFTLNGYELNEYLQDCAAYGEYPTMNGLKDWFAARKARKAAKREKREARKDERRQSRREFWGGLKDAAQRAAEGIGGGVADLDLMEIGGQFLPDEMAGMMPGQSGQMMDEKGLFGPPSLLKNPGKWFSSKRVPTWQKAAVIGGSVVAVDALTGGNIILQRAGIMKKKRK